MLPTNFLFQVSDHHHSKPGVVSRFTFFEQCLEYTALASAVLTVETGGNKKLSRISSSYCVFIAIMVSSDRVLNHCTLSFFNSTFKISLRSKTDSSVSQALKNCEKAFSFFCYFFLNEDSSVEVSVDDPLETTRYVGIKNLEVCVQLCPGDCK